MTTITAAEAYLIELQVETVRTDAMQSFIKLETLFVEIRTADGLLGRGYGYTIGTGGRATLCMLRDHLLVPLLGQDAGDIEGRWRRVYDSSRATSIGLITNIALAAIDVALWDLRALRVDERGRSPGAFAPPCRSTTPKAAGFTWTRTSLWPQRSSPRRRGGSASSSSRAAQVPTRKRSVARRFAPRSCPSSTAWSMPTIR